MWYIAQYEHQLMDARRRARRGQRAQLPIHVRDVRRREGVVSRERLGGRRAADLAVDGEGDSGDCAPTLRNGRTRRGSSGWTTAVRLEARVRFPTLGQVFLVPEDRVVPAGRRTWCFVPRFPRTLRGVLLDARRRRTCDAARTSRRASTAGLLPETCRDSDGATRLERADAWIEARPGDGAGAAARGRRISPPTTRRPREAVARPVTARLGRARSPTAS